MYVEQNDNGRWVVRHDDGSLAGYRSFKSRGSATRELHNIQDAVRQFLHEQEVSKDG